MDHPRRVLGAVEQLGKLAAKMSRVREKMPIKHPDTIPLSPKTMQGSCQKFARFDFAKQSKIGVSSKRNILPHGGI